MNTLRRWIDAKPWRPSALGHVQAVLYIVTLILLANSLLYVYWPGIVAGVLLAAFDVWLFIAASTNWKWDGS